MRKLFWVFSAVCLAHCLAGCSEFIGQGERTASVDVVGDPSDPTPDSTRRPEILGSALPMPDDADLVTDSDAARGIPKPLPDDLSDPGESEVEPDVAGGIGLAKPVSLKTKTVQSKSDN